LTKKLPPDDAAISTFRGDWDIYFRARHFPSRLLSCILSREARSQRGVSLANQMRAFSSLTAA